MLRRFALAAKPAVGWVDAGLVHLDQGAYEPRCSCPRAATLEYLELAPPCVHPIEPRGGWKPSAVATTEDVAVTVLQALDLESELPPRATPLEFRGSELRLEEGEQRRRGGRTGGFRGGPRGARVLLLADIPRDGLYTLSFFGVRAGGQRWLADGCRTRVVCPSPDPTPGWHVDPLGRAQQGPARLRGDARARHARRAAAAGAEEGRPGGLRRDGRAPGPRAGS